MGDSIDNVDIKLLAGDGPGAHHVYLNYREGRWLINHDAYAATWFETADQAITAYICDLRDGHLY